MNHRQINKKYSEILREAEKANGRKEFVSLFQRAARLKSKIELVKQKSVNFKYQKFFLCNNNLIIYFLMNKKGYTTESGGRQNGFALEPEMNVISEKESRNSILIFSVILITFIGIFLYLFR